MAALCTPRSPLATLLLFLLLPITTHAQACRNNAALPLPAKTIFQLAPGNNFTFFENIVSRSNGDLLITMAVPQPNIFLLQNPASACPTFSPLFSVPGGVNGTDGITEIATRPDTFAVIAGNLSLSGNPANGVLGTWAVWEVALQGGTNTSVSGLVNCGPGAGAAAAAAATTLPPTVSARKIADLPTAPRLNGIAAIPGSAAVLVGDSQLGVAFRLDTLTGQVSTALDFPEMKPVPGANSADDALGLNGLKVGKDGFVYFTNAAARTINRVAILPDGSGPMPGATVQTLAALPSAGWMDDLDLRDDGSLWVTTNSPTNGLLAIEPTVAGASGITAQFRSPVMAVGGVANSTVIDGDSAAVFGRGTSGNQMLYVATGSGDEPAKIVQVDTSSCL